MRISIDDAGECPNETIFMDVDINDLLKIVYYAQSVDKEKTVTIHYLSEDEIREVNQCRDI